MNQASEEISIIIPACNEAERLPETLDALSDFLTNFSRGVEVLVVDDASVDGTAEIARGHALSPRVLVLPKRRGKGGAVRFGMKEARGCQLRFFMDADLSVPVRFIGEFTEAMTAKGGSDVLIASRRMPGSRIIVPQPLQRRLGSWAFNFLLRATGLTRSRDTQCGFKAFRAEVADKLFAASVLDGFLFDVELLLRARLEGYLLKEMPVEWEHKGGSRLGAVRHLPSIASEFFYLLNLRFFAFLEQEKR